MRYFLILLVVLLTSANFFAQNKYVIEYDQIFNTDFPLGRTALMYFDDKESVFVDFIKSAKNLQKTNDTLSYLSFIKDRKQEVLEGENFVITVGGKYDTYFINNKELNTFEYTDELGKRQFLITDDYKLNWNITNETRIISNLKAVKATAMFRGRKWIAWFTPDIPYDYGPWKLNGLPGVILEAFDETKRYVFLANKIEKTNDFEKPDLTKLFKIDFKNFILNNFEIIENSLNVDIGRNVEVVSYKFRNGLEIEYEWETKK